MIDQALSWLAGHGKKPFLWVHLYDPHHPYKPPAPLTNNTKRTSTMGKLLLDTQGRLLRYPSSNSYIRKHLSS